MRLSTILAFAAVGGVSSVGAAQQAARAYSYSTSDNDHRAALGVTTTTTGTLRDTLGILITSLTRGGPAEKAGLEEGNRISAINGVSLRASAADVEDSDMSSALTRRLTRELGKVKAGDEIELKLYRDGKQQTMKIKTADADELFRPTNVSTTRRNMEEERDNRPVLGFSLGSTGSRRDTLGVLVMSVTDSTPAAKSGIEEGNRIAAINGVSLKVAKDEAGDREMSQLKVQRLQREISKLKPGENVTLSVYANGRFHDVTMKVARAGDLPKNARGAFTIFGGDGDFNFTMPAMPAMPAMPRMAPMAPMAAPSVRYEISPMVRRQLDEARVQIRNIEPQIRMQLENARPQIQRLREVMPSIGPRIRITRVTV
jgi:serine protease Do